MAKKPIVETIDEIVADEPAKVVISDAEYNRRINLEVTNPEYINPSYDR
jgi:hypothetical protein